MTNLTPDALLRQLQIDCGIPHMPTQLTYQLRLAVSGEGSRAYDWSDKPHRLLYDACSEIERMTAERAGQSHADAGLLEAMAGPAAWLDSWAQHVGKCQGGYVCTCGLTRARSEARAAIDAAKGAGK